MKKRMIVVMLVWSILVGTISSQVMAATYSRDGIEISIDNGAVKLVADGTEYQLAGKLAVRDAWIDNGTAYLWYRNNLVKFCNYRYQGAEVTNLQTLEKAQELVQDADNEIVGYKTEAGEEKGLLSDAEIKEWFKVVEPSAQEQEDSNKSNVKTTDTNSNVSNEDTEKRDVTIINDGNGNSTKVDNTASGKDTEKENNVSVINKGDNNKTDITNKVDEPTSTGKKNDVSVINNGNGNTTTVVNNTTTNITNTIKKDQKVVRNYKVQKKGTVISLLNSKKKVVDYATLKKSVLKYHTRKVKRVKTAVFNSKGNMVVLTKKGKLIVINHNTFKITTISKKGITKCKTSKSLGKWAYRKDGTRFSVAKK